MKKFVLSLIVLVGYVHLLPALHKIQIVLTNPRSVSTAFEKAMMARNDHKVFHEPWVTSWMHHTGHAWLFAAKPPQEIIDAKNYEEIRDLIYRYAEDQPVFLKDMINCFGEDLLKDEAFLSDPNVIITILIRDPVRSIESFFNMCSRWLEASQITDVTKTAFRFDLLVQISEKYHVLRETWPIIVEAEELCQQPETVFKAFCDQAGISFIPEALSWQQGLPEEWKHSADWHQDAANSSSFFIPDRDAQENRFMSIPPEFVGALEEVYQSQRPYYEQLKAMKSAGKKHQAAKDEEKYRVYDESTSDHVKNFYRMNHTYQTLDFVLQKKSEYLPLRKRKMDIWEAVDFFDMLIDESDPDLDLPQRYHLFQTAEALRRDGYPRWLILTGFIHDLGKILSLYGEPQWAVVGDTFPVGCAYSDKIVFPEYFELNTDKNAPEYQTACGIYESGCGLDKVHLSWGHDEYLYQVVKDYLPLEALYIIRYHSFYAAHHESAYVHLMNEQDRRMLPWLKIFSRYDLYSKSPEKLDLDALMPYYRELVCEFFPTQLDW